MKTNTAPGPGSFTVLFFKQIWTTTRGDAVKMLNKLHEGQLNLARLNYGMITLIPKVKIATGIRY